MGVVELASGSECGAVPPEAYVCVLDGVAGSEDPAAFAFVDGCAGDVGNGVGRIEEAVGNAGDGTGGVTGVVVKCDGRSAIDKVGLRVARKVPWPWPRLCRCCCWQGRFQCLTVRM